MASTEGARPQPQSQSSAHAGPPASTPQDTLILTAPPPATPPEPAPAAIASAAGATATTQAQPKPPVNTPPANTWKGRKVKRFRLIDELGEGAMGRVYVAEDEVLKRHVALKLLPAKHRDGRPNHRTERLVREAQSAATLEHPNVVTIYEIDQLAGVHYIAMELVEGGNLERLVQMSGPMEIERACQLIAEAAEALAHAHQRGIIHRDIKPANLLLTRSGRCKVCDFGLAAFDGPDESQRVKCVGTPNFIPPEVALGKKASEQSDIYSLGCTLFFLLTGRPPFHGSSTRDVLKLHVSEPFPDVRKWRPDAPERLVAALEQACSKKPTDRYSDSERFAKVLRTFTISTGSGSNGQVVPVQAQAPQPVVTSAPGMSGYVMMSASGHLSPIPAAMIQQSAAPVSMPQVNLSHHPAPQQQSFHAEVPPIAPVGYEPAPAAANRRVPAPVLYAGAGTLAAVVLIAVGVWIARPGPDKVLAADRAPQALAGSTEAAAPVAESRPTHAGADVLVNGAMEAADTDDGLNGWFIHERFKKQVELLQENGNRFVRLHNEDVAKTVFVDQKVKVDPSWKVVMVSARMRATNFKPGSSAAQDARVAFAFRDAADKRIGNWPPVPSVRTSSPWVERVVTVDVPPGAAHIYLQLAIFNATGTVDFDDVRVVPQLAP